MFYLSLAVTALVLLFLAVCLYLFIKASFSFAPWVPSKTDLLRQALDYLKVQPGTTFADLGSGDGRAVFLAARHFGLRSTGYEISPVPYFLSLLRRWFTPTPLASIKYSDLFSAALGGFDVIYIYGLPKSLHEKLQPKLEREMRPGSYILSYNFSLQGLETEKIFQHSWRRLLIYRWPESFKKISQPAKDISAVAAGLDPR